MTSYYMCRIDGSLPMCQNEYNMDLFYSLESYTSSVCCFDRPLIQLLSGSIKMSRYKPAFCYTNTRRTRIREAISEHGYPRRLSNYHRLSEHENTIAGMTTQALKTIVPVSTPWQLAGIMLENQQDRPHGVAAA